MCDRSKLALWRTIQTGTKEAACSKLSEVLAASPSPLQTEGWQSLLAWCWTQSIACHTTFSEKPEIKAKPNSMRFESKSGREYFSGQRCWLRLICSKNKIVASLSLGPCSNPHDKPPLRAKASWITTKQHEAACSTQGAAVPSAHLCQASPAPGTHAFTSYAAPKPSLLTFPKPTTCSSHQMGAERDACISLSCDGCDAPSWLPLSFPLVSQSFTM